MILRTCSRAVLAVRPGFVHLIEIGLMSQLPDTADFDDPDDEPVPIKGEPLSETVIRERR